MKILPLTAPYPFTLASLLGDGVSEHVVVPTLWGLCDVVRVVTLVYNGGGREWGAGCSPTAPGRCLRFECRGASARVRAWRCEGRPPLPHHLVCVERFTLPYLRRLIYSSRTNGGGFDPCRAPTMSHEVYGASLVATIASHVQGTWIVRIRRAQSLESGLHLTEAWRPATCSCRPEGVR